MFDLHDYVTGPEKLIQTYNEFFNGIIAKGLHGTLLIPLLLSGEKMNLTSIPTDASLRFRT